LIFTFAFLAANPIGGLLVAIPFAILTLHWPAWTVVLASVPLAYLQVIVIDLAWGWLARIERWNRFLLRRRSPRVERLVASGGGFWITFVATPLLGPWLVMAFMRYAQVRQRRVALPILLALLLTAVVLTSLSLLVPRLFVQPNASGRTHANQTTVTPSPPSPVSPARKCAT
jgi:hypothetical protein